YFAVAAVDKAGNQALIASAGPVTLNFTSTAMSASGIGNQAAAARFGKSIAAGYLNGDSYPDVVVGIEYASFATTSSKEGAVLVYLGTASGPHTTPDFVIRPAAGSWAGAAVAVLDFDGDGTQDLAIGAPGVGSFGGAVYVCRGGTRFAQPASPPTVFDPSTCALTIFHAAPSTNLLGFSVARANFDGDSVDDLVIGSPGTAGFVGEAFVIHGVNPMPAASTFALPDDAMVATPAYRAWQFTFTGPGTPQFGTYVYGLGKVEGSADTTEEIGIGGVDQDRAYVYYGRAKPTTSAIAIPTNGTGVVALIGAAGSGVGTGMAGIGDTDGDGKREIVLGVPGEGAGGRVYLINGGSNDSGNPAILTLATATVAQVPTVVSGVGGERLGTFIVNPADVRLGGDLNADGRVDLWVANRTSPWKAYLFYGGATGFGAALASTDATWYFTPAGGDAVSSFLAMLPDLNGDSLPDLAAGDWNSTTQTVTVLK
ncbi:MAG: FG-GAP repeat protein, partial [Deltaproteobacteria bacterium]|nr:FG-GAP repeat protein [Deltaproteobacteria bacterium]